MSMASDDDGGADHRRGGKSGRRLLISGARAATMPLPALALSLAIVLIATGCGGSSSPSVSGSGLDSGRPSTRSSGRVMAQALAYAQCMRRHGISDFPDPTPGPGGGVTFQINGRPGSDLDDNNPGFKAAGRSCRSLWPGGRPPPPPSAQKMAAEVRWAECMRSHGLPGFPDPNSQGAFDSSRFDDSSPAFQTATKACERQEPAGPISAVPGKGPG